MRPGIHNTPDADLFTIYTTLQAIVGCETTLEGTRLNPDQLREKRREFSEVVEEVKRREFM